MVIKKINLFFVTFLGAGYIKTAPGTFASLIISIIFFYLFRLYISIEHFPFLCLAMILVFTYSLYAIKTIENEFKQKDARQIVIDEVIGQSIPILFIEYITYLQTQSFGADLYLYVASFILFRFFDIVKPFPINLIDKKLKNGLGVVMDDLIAGLFSLLIVWIAIFYIL